jgi:hypothetical protein
MTVEVPVLRLGMAGYDEGQQQAAADAARASAGPHVRWEIATLAEADAWWLEGRHTLLMPNGLLRVQPAVPSGRSVQIAPAEVDRPVAFSLPIAAADLHPAVTFDLGDRQACVQVLHQFAAWLQPLVARFALGSSISDQQPTLGAGSWEVLRGGDLLAVVDLKLGAGVEPAATPADFEQATWCIRDHGAAILPPGFLRTTVSQLMWQYAQRTQRDLLPAHYRTRPLYFRRPPRLAQRELKDAHLLLMRELLAHPGMRFLQLQQATGLAEVPLARCLSALYVVGSITSNPQRAGGGALLAPLGRDGQAPSSFPFDSQPDASRPPQPAQRPPADLTAPLPLHW